jgi:hypothetical protein
MASRQRRNPRRLITDPTEAYEDALRLGYPAEVAAEAARQAEANAGHSRVAEEEEDRMVRQRHRESRLWWGLSSEDLG